MTDNRTNSDPEALKILFSRMMAAMRTALPGRVESFDAATQTATVTPSIRRVVTIDGNQTTLQMPKVLKVPVVYPHAQSAGFALTVPISEGDEVLLIVADRSIDLWADNGGIQNPVEPTQPRSHDITDSLAVVGATPSPKALANWLNNGVELRNKARTSYLNVKDAEVEAVNGGSVLRVRAAEGQFHAPDVSLGGSSGSPVARLGDMVQVGSGSSAGLWPIVTAAAKVRAE